MAKGSVRPVVPVLVAFLPMTVKHKERQANISNAILLIKTEAMVGVPNLPHPHYVRLPQTGGHLAYIPAKVFALQACSERLPFLNIAKVPNILLNSLPCSSKPVPVKMSPIVHPDCSDPLVVVFRNPFVRLPLVGAEAPKYVADPTAGDGLDLSPTHPGLKTKLKLFSSPDLHARVIEA